MTVIVKYLSIVALNGAGVRVRVGVGLYVARRF